MMMIVGIEICFSIDFSALWGVALSSAIDAVLQWTASTSVVASRLYWKIQFIQI